MSSGLVVDWCSYDAAKYAVMRWHYSHSMPAGKQNFFGVWEDGKFIGAVIFGYGANYHLGNCAGLSRFEVAELTRVALDSHKNYASRILSLSLDMFKRHNPKMRLVVSYADKDQDHLGILYQAANWLYLGEVQKNGGTPRYRVFGKVMHGRSVYSRWGRGAQNVEWLRAHVDPHAERVYTRGKYKYCYPLDRAMRRKMVKLSKPYPKRGRSVEGDTLATSQRAGSTPDARSRK